MVDIGYFSRRHDGFEKEESSRLVLEAVHLENNVIIRYGMNGKNKIPKAS